MISFLQRVDRFAHKNWVFAPLLLLLFILRLPNFFEPYWYGDEGIYLTIGNALRNGERLYQDIIDHKTPVIYYLAMVSSQLAFRILLFVCMAITTVLFYSFARRLFQNRIAASISALFLLLSTTLPTFEGNIPNGELFVVFFVITGAWILSHTWFFRQFFHEQSRSAGTQRICLFISGVFLSIGILTKVPALFDAAAFVGLVWFTLIIEVHRPVFPPFPFLFRHRVVLRSAAYICVGIVLPIVFSLLYYVLRGSGKAYIDYGLLYNFRYANSWHIHFPSALAEFLFSFKGKLLLLAAWQILLSIFYKRFSRQFIFISSWFGLDFFAALLSNRPYSHYFLQIFPPLALLFGYMWLRLHEKKLRFSEILMSTVGVTSLITVMIILRVGVYPTLSYYTRFLQFSTGQITAETYRNSFDSFMRDNYRAAQSISGNTGTTLFIWGTDPVLYAQTHTAPPGRFTVLFHIKDFHAENETVSAVLAAHPSFIVVIKGEALPQELQAYLVLHYISNATFEHFTLWKRW